MKGVLNHFETIEIHAPGLDDDIEGGGNGPTATDEEVPTKPDTASSPTFENSK